MKALFRGRRGRHVSETRKGRERGISEVLLAALLACLLSAALSLSGVEADEFHVWLNTIRELLVHP